MKSSARTVVVDSANSRRLLITEAIRALGVTEINPLNSGKDLVSYLEVEAPDWIVMPILADERINAFHVLKLITEVPRLRGVRVSLFVDEAEKIHLPLAFELGALSWHSMSYVKDQLHAEIARLFNAWERCGGNATLVAAEFLRPILTERRQWKALLGLEQALLKLFPASPQLLLKLAMAHFLADEREAALTCLSQAELLMPSLADETASLRTRFCPIGEQTLDFEDDDFSADGTVELAPSVPRANVLGVETCLIVDPDTSSQYSITSLLKEAGVTNTVTFGDGEAAARWLAENPEPQLILQEWRLPKLAGPLLLQRLRQQGYLQAPVIVVSSLVKANHVTLLQEMGVAAVLEKPFDQQNFFQTIILTLQQHRRPTEQLALERRIRSLLASGQRGEAERLRRQFAADERILPPAKMQMDALFAYEDKCYAKARDLALEALKGTSDTLTLLNLLGKCFLKTGEHESALKCFSRAQEKSPLNVERLCRMAELELETGDTAAAKAHLSAAARLDANAPVVTQTSCSMALAEGDDDRARRLMGQLESMNGILAFMNNRAVALTRGGQFEEGIALYTRTLGCLPSPWGKTHDLVAYNLGLAHARYGNLDEAAAALGKMQATPASPLARKQAGLLKRIGAAKSSGSALVLASESQKKIEGTPAADAAAGAPKDGAAASNGKEEAPVAEAPQSATVLEIRRGDMCCHLIFRAFDLLDTRTLELLESPPTFVERRAIRRAETFSAARMS